MTITPNMGLVISTIGADTGLQWEQNLNASEYTIDAHNHTPGSGVPIPPAGININAPLSFNNQQATSVQAIVFQPQASLATLYGIYSIGVDLYFNDGAGNVVRITTGGAVNATSSGISSGTATAGFVGSVLVVNADTDTPANIQGASLLLGNNVSGSNYLTLQPPNAMASNYSLTLPPIPGSTSFLTVDTSGNITGSNSTTQGITRQNLVPVGQQVSSSCGAFSLAANQSATQVTNLTVTITTTGRPVMVMMVPDGGTFNSQIEVLTTGVGNTIASQIIVDRDSAAQQYKHFLALQGTPSGGALTLSIPVGSVATVDVVSAGTHTYSILGSTGANNTLQVTNAKLFVYEL